MALIDFIKQLNLIEQITDQLWISLAVWALLIYFVFEFRPNWQFSLILILVGFILTLKALVKKFLKKDLENKTSGLKLSEKNFKKGIRF